MRCLWKLDGLLAVALLGFACSASGVERAAGDVAEDEAALSARVEPADQGESDPARGRTVRERSDQPPALAQPDSTSKPKSAARKRASAAGKTASAGKTADRRVPSRPTATRLESPPKRQSAADGTSLPGGSAAKSKALPAEAASEPMTTTPEVHSLPDQPGATAEPPSGSGTRVRSAAGLPARSSASRAPASRVRVQPSTRITAESAMDSDVRPTTRTAARPRTPTAGPATRDSAQHSTRASAQRSTRMAPSEAVDEDAKLAAHAAALRRTVNAATGANRTAVRPASARSAVRTEPDSRASRSRDVAFEEPEVRNADYHEPRLATRYVTEPPVPTHRRSGGWRMAAMQPAAPRGSGPAEFAPGGPPSVMEEIEGEMQGPIQGPTQGPMSAHEDPSWLDEGDMGCDDCVGGTCAPPRRWGATGGFEALIVRPHFSDPQGLLSTSATQGSNGSEIREESLNYDFNYLGSFRMYAGLRNCACGDEFRFSYWNFGGHDTQRGVANSTTNYCDFLCNITSQPGDRISQRVGLNVNVFDLDMFKPFYLGQSSCGGCSTCGSGDCGSGDCGSGDCGGGSCGPGGCGSSGCGGNDCGQPCCPVWDLRWLGGFRFASINHGLDSQVITAGDTLAAAGQSRATYFGFGPRMGLQGRRYFGAGRLSVYAKGAGSILVGNYDLNITNFNVTPVPTNSFSTSRATRVVPVAELETGVSWRLSPRAVLTGGWLVQSWWDLGLQETMSGNDTANILGFDGFFARAEVVF
jgi:Legionella pneumophila major outer membrane protein precursor